MEIVDHPSEVKRTRLRRGVGGQATYVSWTTAFVPLCSSLTLNLGKLTSRRAHRGSNKGLDRTAAAILALQKIERETC